MKEASISEMYAKKRLRHTLILLSLTAALVLTAGVGISMSPVGIPPITAARIVLNKIPLLGAFFSEDCLPTYEAIVLGVRLPRLFAGMLVGSALAVAGCAMQGMFRNPMASPYILGVSSGAAFGAALAIVLGISFGGYAVPAGAFVFATVAVFIVYSVSRVRGKVLTETLLLAGIAVGAFFSALVSFMNYIAGERLPAIVFWIMGGLWASSWDKVIVASPLVIVGIAAMLPLSRDLNLMLVGEGEAVDLGVNVEKTKRLILVLSALITAAAVCVSGVIGFVGLIIPHTMRIIVGPDHRILLPSSCLVGAIFLVWTDTLARAIIWPAELPVGVITALFGAPFFLYLLRRRKRVAGW